MKMDSRCMNAWIAHFCALVLRVIFLRTNESTRENIVLSGTAAIEANYHFSECTIRLKSNATRWRSLKFEVFVICFGRVLIRWINKWKDRNSILIIFKNNKYAWQSRKAKFQRGHSLFKNFCLEILSSRRNETRENVLQQRNFKGTSWHRDIKSIIIFQKWSLKCFVSIFQFIHSYSGYITYMCTSTLALWLSLQK